MQKNSYRFEIKSLAETGVISGYASVFNVEDAHNDLITSGAFNNSILNHKKSKQIKLLWQHQQEHPVGIIENIFEDRYGLRVEARLLLEVDKAREAYALIKAGAINGLSIGFEVEKSHHVKNVRIITKINLWEISLVTFPANHLAQINNFKNKETSMKTSNQYNVANTWEQFKEINDRKEQEIAKYGSADPLTNECLKSIGNSLDSYKSRLDKIEAAVARPAMSATNYNGLDQHKTAFNDYLRMGVEKSLNDFERKALSASSNQDGGYLVTSQLSNQITKLLQERSIIRQLASIETISTDSLDILEDLTDLGAGWVSEVQKREDTSTPTISKKKIMVHELYAQPKATQKLIDDANIDIEKWLTSKLVDVFASKENESFINGDGIGKPKGILSYEAGDVWGKIQNTISDNGAINSDALYKLYHSLDEDYAHRAAFIMSRSALSEIRMLKDKSTGRYIWNPALSENMSSTLFGSPVYVSSHVPEVAKNATCVIFADLASGYKIVDRVGIRVMRDPFTDKPFVKFYSTKRVGGDVVNFNAIKLLKLA
jgi:HK97 family phage major capsid protein/HK97 family phage prohead protease